MNACPPLAEMGEWLSEKTGSQSTVHSQQFFIIKQCLKLIQTSNTKANRSETVN